MPLKAVAKLLVAVVSLSDKAVVVKGTQLTKSSFETCMLPLQSKPVEFVTRLLCFTAEEKTMEIVVLLTSVAVSAGAVELTERLPPAAVTAAESFFLQEVDPRIKARPNIKIVFFKLPSEIFIFN